MEFEKGQLYQKTNICCVEKLILTKIVHRRKKEIQNVTIVGDLMSPTTKAVLPTRNELSGNAWSKTKFFMPQS